MQGWIRMRRYVAALFLLTCTVGAANAATVKVQNLTNKEIALVYASPAWTDNFRDVDQLLGSDEYIMPGQTWALNFEAGNECNFDLRVVFADSTRADRYDVNLCHFDGWTLVGN